MQLGVCVLALQCPKLLKDGIWYLQLRLACPAATFWSRNLNLACGPIQAGLWSSPPGVQCPEKGHPVVSLDHKKGPAEG